MKNATRKVITIAVAAVLVVSLGTVGALAAATASRVNPENVREFQGEQGIVRMYINLDENDVPVDLTDEEWQEVNDLIAFRDENGNIIEHVCDESCQYPLEIQTQPLPRP